ncbi:MAG TPA: hypothetical protein VG797_01305 [Phycisphaerales bacterium]|nr:hypothetical protein [Phycisphaerales bacterium]
MRAVKILVSSLILGVTVAPAFAQNDSQPTERPNNNDRPPREGGDRPRGPGGGPGMGMMGPQLSPEASKAAWEAEAKGVAASLGLDAKQTSALIDAYAAARLSHTAAMDALRKKLMEEGDDAGGGRERMTEMREAFEKLNTTEKGKLERAIKDATSPEQAKKAMEPLGTFSRQWDGMVDAVLGLKLDEAKQAETLKAIEKYVAATGKAMSGGADADRDARRLAMTEARDALNDSLKKTLNEEQLKKVQDTMGRGGRGGPGGPGGAGGGGRGNRDN